ncbi:hypothetical protein F5Y08DRAFT_304790 [Xylaria arbuscula]|nr:hypothetical protein F5Y08DRAFT_304790 [Xylaria arbuscula]
MLRHFQHMRSIFTRAREYSTTKSSRKSTTRSSTSRPPFEVLYPSSNAHKKIEVDIIAVHGLGSNVDWSWTWQDRSGHRPTVRWLQDADMLPHVIPQARIIAYNYESRWHADAPRTRLRLCGEEFVRSLHQFRTDTSSERPIVFMAHSLGGLVVLYGLLFADRNKSFNHVLASTVGFMSLGTPFRGTKMQSIATKVAWLMNPMGSHDGIIKDLEQDGRQLADDVHAFCELRNRMDIPATCCFELYDSDYGKKIGLAGFARGRAVEEESACIPGWDRMQMYTDHFKLNKFAGPNDRSFIMVSGELLNMCVNRGTVMARRKPTFLGRHFMVPFGRNTKFVGREAILEQLLDKAPPSANRDDCQYTAIEGLGGIGKTQIALEAAYQIRDEYPNCSAYWVPVIDLVSFENAYREIGRLLQLPGINDENTDTKLLVKTGLSDARAGSWLLIIDNADDTDMLFSCPNLVDYLPFSREGSILFTTRNHEVTVRLDIPQENNVIVPNMDDDESTRLLQIGLKKGQMEDAESAKRLLHFLANLPLAIKQASAYMALNRNVTISQYLEICKSSNTNLINLLDKKFEDRYRYKDYARRQNPIATTWLISFEHISGHNPQAADYLKFICFLGEKDIPLSLLPVVSKTDMAEAIGLLNAYAFITERDDKDSFDIHRLVRLVMRNWLQEIGEWDEWASKVRQRLTREYLTLTWTDSKMRHKYLPHVGTTIELFNSRVWDAQVTREDVVFLFNVAEGYFINNSFDRAENLYQRVLSLEELLGDDNLIICKATIILAFLLTEKENFVEAGQLGQQALERYERLLSENSYIALEIMPYLYAHIWCLRGREEDGKTCQPLKEKIETVLGGTKSNYTLFTAYLTCQLFIIKRLPEPAAKVLEVALNIYREVYGREIFIPEEHLSIPDPSLPRKVNLAIIEERLNALIEQHRAAFRKHDGPRS